MYAHGLIKLLVIQRFHKSINTQNKVHNHNHQIGLKYLIIMIGHD